MTTSPEILPFFVYGTLMSGFGNDGRFDYAPNHITARTAEVASAEGFALYAHEDYFPYAVISKQDSIEGELVTITNAADWPHVLRSLDALEGYRGPDCHNHYDRIITEVKTADGRTHRAYIYVSATQSHIRDGLPRIESGSWAQWKHDYHDIKILESAHAEMMFGAGAQSKWWD